MITLTNAQARRMLIRYQALDGSDGFNGLEGARSVMDRLGTIQFDPLNVAGRNPDLVLQARVRGYRPEHLAALLYREHALVDGYDKEMCIYNARDFGRFAPQRVMMAADTRAWLTNRRGQGEAFDMLEDILGIIAERGPCALTDIPIGESRDFNWGPRRPSGAAMEYLFRAGRLCVADKKGTIRRFDLAERVLPEAYLEAPETDTDAFADWYVRRRLGCVGLLWTRMGGAWQGYVVSNDRARKAALQRLAARGEVVPCRVEGLSPTFYAFPEAVAMADSPVRRHARFIAPLDNLMWDRGMIEALFGFRYRWEVYVPVDKREYGYYVLPVLYGDRFVARFEPENVSKAGELRVAGWWWEPGVRPSTAMLDEIERAFVCFGRFLRVPVSPGCMDAVRAAKSSAK